MTNFPAHPDWGRCHSFYVGNGYNLHNSTSVRVDTIEFINSVPTLLFIMFLLFTLPWAVSKFWKARGSKTGLIAYFVLIWIIALFRGIRFIILWVYLKGDSTSHVNAAEIVVYSISLALSDTAEASFLLFFLNGMFGSPKWLDRRVIIQSILLFLVNVTAQLIITFVGRFQVFVDDDPANSPFWFTKELIFTLGYLLVLSLKFIPGTREKFPPGAWIPVYLVILLVMHGITAIGQAMLIGRNDSGFCPMIVGSISYYLISAPLLYGTFLGAYLHPSWCSCLPCCRNNQDTYSTLFDDTYEYQQIDSLPRVQNSHWIPPSQLSMASPFNSSRSNNSSYSDYGQFTYDSKFSSIGSEITKDPEEVSLLYDPAIN